ncbi:MAG: hypothetical protein C0621_07170 [Desulfuromonas sp.]|nr:MAG: hypothetical protein C0621_07170 [Desulfuromonas sp.]
MTRHLILLCAIALSLTACEKQPPPATQPTSAPQHDSQPLQMENGASTSSLRDSQLLLRQPFDLERYEVPSQALQTWFDLRRQHPALILYANDPLLQRTSPEIQENLLTVLKQRDLSRLRVDIANPALLPPMTLHAALELGLFSSVYWVVPVESSLDTFSLDIFKDQMLQLGALSDDEARTLTLRDGIISGTVRGVSFHALHPDAALSLDGPAVLHVDLSYLAPLYHGEIKTPLYPLIYRTLQHLRDQNLNVIASTFSYSQLFGQVPLGSRFLGRTLAQIFATPDMLAKNVPPQWQERADALYLPELFQSDKARTILLQRVSEQPDDPSLHYALYTLSRKVKSAQSEALAHLDNAVKLDASYALEYQKLAPQAEERGRPDEALRMLRLAHDAAPENPYYTLELARGLMTAGLQSEAYSLVQGLQKLDWSPYFYPDMPTFLANLALRSDSAARE